MINQWLKKRTTANKKQLLNTAALTGSGKPKPDKI